MPKMIRIEEVLIKAQCVQRGGVLCVHSGVQRGYTCPGHLWTDSELHWVRCTTITDLPRHVSWSHLLFLQDPWISRSTHQAHFHWDWLVFRRRSVSNYHVFHTISVNVTANDVVNPSLWSLSAVDIRARSQLVMSATIDSAMNCVLPEVEILWRRM